MRVDPSDGCPKEKGEYGRPALIYPDAAACGKQEAPGAWLNDPKNEE
jgi:hypothetical protein